MQLHSRKNFLRIVSSLAAWPLTSFTHTKPLLSFSTLGCPDWSFAQIIDFASQHGYAGIEMRGLQRQLDLPLSPPFSTTQSRQATRALMKEKGLSFVSLGSSANLHLAPGEERVKALVEARRYINLAKDIGCPYVRVFPNRFPKEQSKNETIALIVWGLKELGDYAKEKGVKVLMETHGDVVKTEDLVTIMQSASHSAVGLVWDIANMWTITKEPPAEVYKQLKKYIRHTHIKDASFIDGNLQYTLLGQGDVPIGEAIQALSKGGYAGYYSFEWEKLWHPQLAEPEVALAHYPTAIKQYF